MREREELFTDEQKGALIVGAAMVAFVFSLGFLMGVLLV